MTLRPRWLECVAAALLALALSNATACADPPDAFSSAADAARYLIKVADVTTDAEFRQQLANNGQRDDHPTPRALRKLFKGEEIARCTFTQGVSHQGGSLALYWSVNKCGIAGEAAAVRQRLFGKLAAMGFKPFPSPEKRYKVGYHRDLAGATETVLVHPFNPWDGARRPVAQTDVLWTVRSTSNSPLPKYLEMKSVMPVLYDKRIDASIYRLFQDDPLVRIACGGTWTKYYSLRVDVACSRQDAKAADALHPQILDRLQQAGFKQTKRPQFSTWDMFLPGESPHGRPIVQLKIEEDPCCVCLSILPE